MCTTLTLKTENGSVIVGRTDEFGNYYHNDLVLFPRNYVFTNRALGDGPLKIKSQYAILGTNVGTLFGEKLSIPELIDDGMNEAGLSMSMLYFPSYAHYKFVDELSNTQMDVTALGRSILAKCATLEEVTTYITAFQGKFVAQIDQPLHYMFVDKTGNSLIAEPDKPGYFTLYKENNGIMTNSPSYNYHMMNLNQYVNVQQIDGNVSSPIKGACGKEIYAHGISGGFGLPGDTSPASRFIRASYFRDTTTRKDLITANDGVLRMFRILNNFDITPGMSLKHLGAGKGEGSAGANANPVDYKNVAAGHTDHTDIKDLENGRYFYKTQNNQSPRYAQFSDYDLNAKQVRYISMENDDSISYQKVSLNIL
ncbi:linear amide C-N hydrolase [Lactococcus garvieae]|uniref:linear amide C-N hydrolase n=1 Tax=Lactococcus garvieae TaxID=1363 RepID=UPI003854110F